LASKRRESEEVLVVAGIVDIGFVVLAVEDVDVDLSDLPRAL